MVPEVIVPPHQSNTFLANQFANYMSDKIIHKVVVFQIELKTGLTNFSFSHLL